MDKKYFIDKILWNSPIVPLNSSSMSGRDSLYVYPDPYEGRGIHSQYVDLNDWRVEADIEETFYRGNKPVIYFNLIHQKYL